MVLERRKNVYADAGTGDGAAESSPSVPRASQPPTPGWNVYNRRQDRRSRPDAYGVRSHCSPVRKQLGAPEQRTPAAQGPFIRPYSVLLELQMKKRERASSIAVSRAMNSAVLAVPWPTRQETSKVSADMPIPRSTGGAGCHGSRIY